MSDTIIEVTSKSIETTLHTKGKYCDKDVLVRSTDSNLKSNNIKNGVTIFGVTGTSATPAEISSSSAMTALLVAENVGNVYKYTGTSDSLYTNGQLYEVVQE